MDFLVEEYIYMHNKRLNILCVRLSFLKKYNTNLDVYGIKSINFWFDRVIITKNNCFFAVIYIACILFRGNYIYYYCHKLYNELYFMLDHIWIMD